MLHDNIYHAEAESAWKGLGSFRDAMNARLTDIDRRAVDILLAGEQQDGDGLTPAMLERVNTARRFLSLLGTMPAEEPSAGLVAATLSRISASDVVATQTPTNPSANV